MAFVAPTAYAAPFGAVDATGLLGFQGYQDFSGFQGYQDFTGFQQPLAYTATAQPFVYQQPVVQAPLVQAYPQAYPQVYEQPPVVYEQQPVVYEQPIVQAPAPTMASTITNRGPPNVPVPTWTRKRDPSYSHPELFLTGVGNGMYQQFRSKKNDKYPFHHPGI